MNGSLIRKPGALLPLAMALAALLMPFAYVALFGNVRHEDEGPVARLWQLLMLAQLPAVAYFAARWLPRAPRQALLILALQAALMLAALAAVLILESMAR